MFCRICNSAELRRAFVMPEKFLFLHLEIRTIRRVPRHFWLSGTNRAVTQYPFPFITVLARHTFPSNS